MQRNKAVTTLSDVRTEGSVFNKIEILLILNLRGVNFCWGGGFGKGKEK